MRQRLSWNEEKVAEIMKQADPYTMNQDRKNPPVEKYETGDPSAWAEDQNKNTPWKNEGRTETGHPAPAREAVVQARKLEDKALKCITIAQRMLPGALDEMIEDQATDLMFLPENSITATLQRQSDLATKIASEADDDAKKEEGDEIDASKCKKEEEEVAAKKKDEEEEVAAKKKVEVPKVEVPKVEVPPEEEIAAKKKVEVPKVEVPPEEEIAAKKKVEVPPEVPEAPEKEVVQANDKDLLDILFDNAEVAAATEAAAPKTGAKKLSGLVKQASSSSDPLDNLWDTPPDVSSVFK
jgi:hypothetical protein